MVLVGMVIVLVVLVGLVVRRATRRREEAGDVAPTGSVRSTGTHPGWVIRVPRVVGVYAWIEHGAEERDGRYFVDGWEVIFADPEPGEPSLAVYRETSAPAARAIRAQEAARSTAIERRAQYLRRWAA